MALAITPNLQSSAVVRMAVLMVLTPPLPPPGGERETLLAISPPTANREKPGSSAYTYPP